MPIVPFREVMADAFRQRYGAGVLNIVNDLAREALLQAAEEARSPVLVQTSTILKITYRRSNPAFVHEARAGNKWDSPSLFKHVKEMGRGSLEISGFVAKA